MNNVIQPPGIRPEALARIRAHDRETEAAAREPPLPTSKPGDTDTGKADEPATSPPVRSARPSGP